VADMQVAVWFGRKSGLYPPIIFTALDVLDNDVSNKI